MLMTAGPPLMLGLIIVILVIIRGRSVRLRLLVETLLLVALLAFFCRWGGSPLPSSIDLAKRPDALWLRALAVIWWLIGARLCASAMAVALGQDAHSRQARLLSDLVAAAIYLTAGVVVVNSVLGLQVKGLIATSGLIAILFGLASQSTLADLFSGVAIGLNAPFHVGDRVSIGEQEGRVVQLDWRAVRVQTDDDDVAIIPNSNVAKSLIVNRSVPTPTRAASVEVPIPAPFHPERVVDLLHQAVLLSPSLLAEPPTSVALKRLGARTGVFSIGFHVASSAELTSARSQLLHAVHRLLTHAGVQGEPAPTQGQLLTALSLFESLPIDQIAELERELVPRRLQPGSPLYRQGDEAAAIYVVSAGIVELRRQPLGEDGCPDQGAAPIPCGRLGPGELLGELSLMSGEPHPVSVVALTPSEVLELPRASLEVLLRQDAMVEAALAGDAQRGQVALQRVETPPAAAPSKIGGLQVQLRRLLLTLGLSERNPPGV